MTETNKNGVGEILNEINSNIDGFFHRSFIIYFTPPSSLRRGIRKYSKTVTFFVPHPPPPPPSPSEESSLLIFLLFPFLFTRRLCTHHGCWFPLQTQTHTEQSPPPLHNTFQRPDPQFRQHYDAQPCPSLCVCVSQRRHHRSSISLPPEEKHTHTRRRAITVESRLGEGNNSPWRGERVEKRGKKRRHRSPGSGLTSEYSNVSQCALLATLDLKDNHAPPRFI